MAYTDINSEEPPYTAEDKEEIAKLVYRHIWQQSASGWFGSSPKARGIAVSPALTPDDRHHSTLPTIWL